MTPDDVGSNGCLRHRCIGASCLDALIVRAIFMFHSVCCKASLFPCTHTHTCRILRVYWWLWGLTENCVEEGCPRRKGETDESAKRGRGCFSCHFCRWNQRTTSATLRRAESSCWSCACANGAQIPGETIPRDMRTDCCVILVHITTNHWIGIASNPLPLPHSWDAHTHTSTRHSSGGRAVSRTQPCWWVLLWVCGKKFTIKVRPSFAVVCVSVGALKLLFLFSHTAVPLDVCVCLGCSSITPLQLQAGELKLVPDLVGRLLYRERKASLSHQIPRLHVCVCMCEWEEREA